MRARTTIKILLINRMSAIDHLTLCGSIIPDISNFYDLGSEEKMLRNIHGVATSAKRLENPRSINGVLFDGTSDINVNIENAPEDSDGRLKHNEKDVVDAIGTIKKLKLLTYDKTKDITTGDLSDVDHWKEIGFIAQDVLSIPELAHLVIVPEDVEKEPYRLNYNGIYRYLVQAVQELHKELVEERNKLAKVESRIDELEKYIRR